MKKQPILQLNADRLLSGSAIVCQVRAAKGDFPCYQLSKAEERLDLDIYVYRQGGACVHMDSVRDGQADLVFSFPEAGSYRLVVVPVGDLECAELPQAA